MTHRLRAALFLLCVSLASPALAAVPEVFIEPFSLYNTPDLDSLAQGLRSMLASRLEGEGYSVRTQGDAPTSAGNWVVRTSITRLGKIYSLDAALEPAAGSAEGSRSYQTAEGMEKLVPALQQVAEHLQADLLIRIRMQPAPADISLPAPAPQSPAPQPPAPQSPAPQPPAAVPALSSSPGAPAAAGPPPADDAEASLQAALRNQRLGPEVTGEATSMTVGDVDGDGNNEILVLMADTIVAFRDVGGEIRQVWDSATPREFVPKTLSSGDIDGNRIPEVFVAGIRDHSPTTQALEWFGSALAPKGGRVFGFLRAVPHPEQGPLLLGMAGSAGASLFGPGIYNYRWDGTSYDAEDLSSAPERAIGVNLDFLRLGKQGQVVTVITTQRNELQGLDGVGGVLFQLDEKVKESRVKLFGEEKNRDYLDEDIVRISGRTLAYRSPTGRDYVLVYKNFSGLNRVFTRLNASFSGGQVVTYNWDGLGLSPGPGTSKYSGYVADIGMGTVTGAYSPTLYVVLVRTDTGLFNDPATRLVAYDLPAPGPFQAPTE